MIFDYPECAACKVVSDYFSTPMKRFVFGGSTIAETRAQFDFVPGTIVEIDNKDYYVTSNSDVVNLNGVVVHKNIGLRLA